MQQYLFGIMLLLCCFLWRAEAQEATETPDATAPSPRIALTANGNHLPDIFVLDLVSGDWSRITQHPDSDANPTWSPNGMQIAFNSFRHGNEDIYIYNLETETLQNITNSPDVNETVPRWSPDGDVLAFNSSTGGKTPEIGLYDIETGRQQRLTNNSFVDSNPSWLPDSRGLVFNSNRNGNSDIYTMNHNGTDVTAIIDTPVNEFAPVYAPDGRYLAYVVAANTTRIVLYDTQGGDERVISPLEFDSLQPIWSPDSQCVTYDVSLNGSLEAVYLYHLPTQEMMALPLSQQEVFGIVWTENATCNDLLALLDIQP